MKMEMSSGQLDNMHLEFRGAAGSRNSNLRAIGIQMVLVDGNSHE